MIKWFEECADGWRAIEPLRKPVRFQVHNLARTAAPSGRFRHRAVPQRDALSEPREEDARVRAAGRGMAEDGWLMLGAGETVIGQTTKLGADIKARGLYRLVGDGSRIEKRQRRPTSCSRGLTRTAVSCANCGAWTSIHRPAFAEFRRARSCRSR